jgi:hypothetical protein
MESEKFIKHLEKFHKFLEKERRMKLDHHFFLSCYYFGEGKIASFDRRNPNKISFFLPIVYDENDDLIFDFDEKAFLEQIFYQALSLQFEQRKNKFESVIEKHKIDEIHFRRAFIGALHYGIYSFDVHKESMGLEDPTDYLKKKEFKPEVNEFQVSFALDIVPLIDDFYKTRRGLDEDFLSQLGKIYTDWIDNRKVIQGEKSKEVKNREIEDEVIESGMIFKSE